MSEAKPIRAIQSPVRITYTYTPGRAASRFLRSVAEGRILGQRCPSCQLVYTPPRGACPKCGVPTRDEVEVADRGTIASFSIVRVPSEGIAIELPFVSASILLDGSDIPFFHVIGEVDVETVRMGMRVEAVWKPAEELTASLESIRYFRPSGEPDVPFEQFKERL